jgi:hypothetical protein
MFCRQRRNRNSFRSPTHLERLEQRLPLAGNVTAELTGSTLRLAGDNLANDVMVASVAGGRIAVIGMNTTINGGTGAFVSSTAVTSIVANFNGGDDAVGFGNRAADFASQRLFAMLAFSPASAWSGEQQPPAPFDVAALQARIDAAAGGVTMFSIPGSLTVATGDGNDSLGISGDLGGSVVVNLGSADIGNGVVIGAEEAASRVGGSVSVKVLGNVVVNTGTGNDGDTVRLVGDIRRDVSVTTGGGRDTVCVSSSVGWVSTAGSDPVSRRGFWCSRRPKSRSSRSMSARSTRRT